MISKYDYLNQTTNLRLFLHNEVYRKDNKIISNIIEYIPNFFDVFTINYDEFNLSLKIKIKKTNMKKNDPNYIHHTNYYYPIINHILVTVFNNNIDSLNKIIFNNKDKYTLLGTELSYALNTETVCSLYNMTTLLDNVIVINL